MKPYEKIAVDFVTALVDSRYKDAHALLSPPLQKKFSAAKLEKQLADMYSGYASGPAIGVRFDPEFSMDDWPAKKPNEIGWVYVGIEGEGFLEALTIIVGEASTGLEVHSIEWGRP